MPLDFLKDFTADDAREATNHAQESTYVDPFDHYYHAKYVDDFLGTNLPENGATH